MSSPHSRILENVGGLGGLDNVEYGSPRNEDLKTKSPELQQIDSILSFYQGYSQTNESR